MSALPQDQVYNTIGEEGFQRLVAAFYEGVKRDDILGPMYPADDWEGSEKRLRDFLVFRFGGPQRYIEERGHPRLRIRHFPFAIDEAARDRWLLLMDRAFEQARIDPAAEQTLREFFRSTASFMINRG